MPPPIRPIPVVHTSAPDAAHTTAPIVIHGTTGITMGNDLMAPGTPPANSLPVFPTHPFAPPFGITLPPLHFNPSNPFPTSSGGLFNEAAASDVPIGTFDPYHSMYPAVSSSSQANNHTLIVGPSTAAQRPAAGTDHFKRSRPQETPEGNSQPKRRKVEKTAKHAVMQQETVYQAFQVGRSEPGRSNVTPGQYEAAAEPNHGQSNGAILSSMRLPVVNEESTTNAGPPPFNLLPRLPDMTDREYAALIKAQISEQFPDAGI